MYILKQTQGDCIHYSIVDSIVGAVAELNCETALLFELDLGEYSDSKTILIACQSLEDAGDYHNLFDIIEAFTTNRDKEI